jgi:hypothetical protein
VSSFAILWHAPEIEQIPAEYHHTPILVYLAVHCGEEQRAQQDLMQLREFGSPIADFSDTLPYLEMQKFFDADYPAHDMRYYWKSHYLASLPDDAIAVLVSLNERSPSPHSTLDIWQLGGAFSRLGPPTRPSGTGLHRSCLASSPTGNTPRMTTRPSNGAGRRFARWSRLQRAPSTSIFRDFMRTTIRWSATPSGLTWTVSSQ